MPRLDALDALHQANPRHDAAFEETVAVIAGRTRTALLAAGSGTAGATPPVPRIGAGPNRRGRWLFSLVVAGCALFVALLLVIRGATSVPGAAHSQAKVGTAGAGPASAGAPATTSTSTNPNPGGGTGAGASVPGSTTGSTVAATTVPAPPGPSSSSPVTGRPTVTTRVPVTIATSVATTPATTPPTAPPTSVAPFSAPTCGVSALQPGSPLRQSVVVQDTGSGLASITNVVVTNGTVTVPAFTPGTKATVIVVATKTDPARDTVWSFVATDVAGHATYCR